MKQFKKDFLPRFDGIDKGKVEQYLGCELMHNRSDSRITLDQKVYAERVLRTYGDVLQSRPL